MILSLRSGGTGWLRGSIHDYGAGVRGFEPALALSIALFSQIFSKFYAGPLALLTTSGCRTSSHCQIYDALHVTLLTRVPLFSRVYIEKIRGPGDKARAYTVGAGVP